jgi:hypothetical protein
MSNPTRQPKNIPSKSKDPPSATYTFPAKPKASKITRPIRSKTRTNPGRSPINREEKAQFA